MTRERAKVVVRGAVQGVGFRPFVYRLANELALDGWVVNSAQGVFIEVEGPRPALDQFLSRLVNEKPPRAALQSVESSILDPVPYRGFEIRESDEAGEKTAFILPDIATCADCLREIFDPADRRFRYPFTNCTNCGPRFSIIEALPYDRAHTSMRKFAMCPDCAREYARSDRPPFSCGTDRLSALWSDACELWRPGRRTRRRAGRRARASRGRGARGEDSRAQRARWISVDRRRDQRGERAAAARTQTSRGETVRAHDANARSPRGKTAASPNWKNACCSHRNRPSSCWRRKTARASHLPSRREIRTSASCCRPRRCTICCCTR